MANIGKNGQIKMDFTGLDKISYMLKSKYAVKVGILGKTNTHSNLKNNKREVATNADIGFLQEFGSYSGKIPARSFLRMPIKEKLAENVEKSEKLSKQAFEDSCKEGKLLKFFKLLGIMCEKCVLDAFATRGFAKWKPNAPSTIAHKKSDSPLIDTGELRKAVTSEVIGD